MMDSLRRLFNLREGEGLKASLMFTYGLLIISVVMMLKSVRLSLFVTQSGAAKLPYVYVLVACVAALVAWFYAKHAKRFKLNFLISATFGFAILFLLAFWFSLNLGLQSAWLPYVLYVWVAIFSVLSGNQFWLLTNDIYDAREAKRLFGFIGAGAISGGILGGLLVNFLATRVGTTNLIFFCILFILLCQIIVSSLWKKSAHYLIRKKRRPGVEKSQAASSDNPLKLLASSKHLSYYAGIITLGVIVGNLADYQFGVIAERSFLEVDRLTAFFGLMSFLLSIISLGIQLFVTSRVLKSLGVVATLFFLPAGLLIGAVAVLFAPVLGSAILIRISDGSFKHSTNRSGLELLALPIPPDIKTRARAFIDIFLKNFARGLAGFGLIALTVGLKFSLPLISVVMIVFIGLWIFLIFKTKREYINAFRQAIEKRTIDLDEQALNLEDAAVFENFLKTLEGKNERKILYVLNLLEDVENKELIPHLQRLIEHPSPEIRALVLRMSQKFPELDLSQKAQDLIGDQNQKLQSEAVCYLYKTREDRISFLKSYLQHEDCRVRVAAIICAAGEWRESKDFREEIDMRWHLTAMLEGVENTVGGVEEQRFIKINTANAIGKAQDAELSQYLLRLVEDNSTEVMQAAIANIGSAPSTEFLPVLINHLNTKHIRKTVRDSLAEYGEEIIDTLAVYLRDAQEDRGRRIAILKVLALIGSQKSVHLLWQTMETGDRFYRYESIRALNKLRARFPTLRFDPHTIRQHIDNEIDLYKTILRSWLQQKQVLSQNTSKSPEAERDRQRHKAQALLASALEEKLENCLERIFRLLGLKYPPRDMLNTYLGLTSDKTTLRANAIEFLDNLLETSLKKTLIPIVESLRPDVLKRTSRLLKTRTPSEEESVELILAGDDHWLKACTIYLLALDHNRHFETTVRSLQETGIPLVRETAILYLKRLEEQDQH
jgi:AAA family ATP:ADP antiporter